MSKKKTTEEFVAEAKALNGDLDSYEKVEYTGNKNKVCITCKVHGDYWMTPNSYLSGQRCPDCGRKKVNAKRVISLEKFKERAKQVHGDKYDYSKVEYVNALTKVEVICPKHGSFYITPAHLWNGHGCKECANKVRREKESNTYEYFEKMANEVHGNKYTYHNDYVNNKTKVLITCPIHGDFEQRPDDHLNGKGCSSCGHIISKAEEDIYNFLLGILPKTDIIRHDTAVLDGLEIDILIPKYNLGIEYNGLRWHSEQFGKGRNYHVDKTNIAESKGVHLIQIFEDEWIKNKELILEKLCHFLGCSDYKDVVGGRKCTVKETNKDAAQEFLEKYHIQGFVGSSVYLGAYYQGILVGVMSFLKERDGEWNLTRFATNTTFSWPGLANKMFKFFVRNYNPLIVKTFLDRRWAYHAVNVYDRMHFELVEIERPDYRYVVGTERKHKFGFRKNILHKRYGFPLSMTEREMTKELGIYRIWDCGLFKYVWKKKMSE